MSNIMDIHDAPVEDPRNSETDYDSETEYDSDDELQLASKLLFYSRYYARLPHMSDKEYSAYINFRLSRKYMWPEYYTEMTIAPEEEDAWAERLQEMRDDGLWEDT
jgi:hypothetical protein